MMATIGVCMNGHRDTPATISATAAATAAAAQRSEADEDQSRQSFSSIRETTVECAAPVPMTIINDL